MATRNVNKSAHQRIVPLPLEQLSKLHCIYRDKQAVRGREVGRLVPFLSILYVQLCKLCASLCKLQRACQSRNGQHTSSYPSYNNGEGWARAAELMVGWLAKTHASGNCLTKAGTVTYTQLHRHATPSLGQVSVSVQNNVYAVYARIWHLFAIGLIVHWLVLTRYCSSSVQLSVFVCRSCMWL